MHHQYKESKSIISNFYNTTLTTKVLNPAICHLVNFLTSAEGL